MWDTKKSDNGNKEHEQKENNQSLSKQVESSYLQEEMKYLKKTLDILLKRQWLKTPKDNKEDSTEILKNQKIKQKLIKNTETNGEIKKKSITRKRVRRSKKLKNTLRNFTIYYQNVRGLRWKLDSLQEMPTNQV